MPTAERFLQARVARPSRTVFLALLAAALLQMAWYYPRLPERMASHFDVAGRANGFLPKPAFFILYAVVLALLSVVFLLTPMLLARLPNSAINLPNRDYWLAPERRVLALAKVQAFSVGFGNVMLLFLLLVFRDVMRANLLEMPKLTMRIWVFLVLLAAFSIVWTVRLLRSFRLPT
jgi:uncharacterized membrane protein